MQQFLLDDKDILVSCSIGSHIAFGKLFNEYHKKIYATSYKVTRSEYISEEIVQEVFVDLWKGRLHLRKVDNPSGYIFKIVYSKIYQHFKESENARRLKSGLRRKIESDDHNDTEEKINFNETRNLINNAVDKLPPQRKLIYKLSREQGLNNRQITERLNTEISPLTVKKHLMLALNDLRTNLMKASCS